MEWFIDGVFLLLSGYFVQTQSSLLGSCERARLMFAVLACFLLALVEGSTAECAR
jgi:hypothetical protein